MSSEDDSSWPDDPIPRPEIQEDKQTTCICNETISQSRRQWQLYNRSFAITTRLQDTPLI